MNPTAEMVAQYLRVCNPWCSTSRFSLMNTPSTQPKATAEEPDEGLIEDRIPATFLQQSRRIVSPPEAPHVRTSVSWNDSRPGTRTPPTMMHPYWLRDDDFSIVGSIATHSVPKVVHAGSETLHVIIDLSQGSQSELRSGVLH